MRGGNSGRVFDKFKKTDETQIAYLNSNSGRRQYINGIVHFYSYDWNLDHYVAFDPDFELQTFKDSECRLYETETYDQHIPSNPLWDMFKESNPHMIEDWSPVKGGV